MQSIRSRGEAVVDVVGCSVLVDETGSEVELDEDDEEDEEEDEEDEEDEEVAAASHAT